MMRITGKVSTRRVFSTKKEEKKSVLTNSLIHPWNTLRNEIWTFGVKGAKK